MKLLSLRLINFKQFKDVSIDFTDRSGNVLSKICFIGRNGTGKSTLLKLLNAIIKEPFSISLDEFAIRKEDKYVLIYSISLNGQIYHVLKKAGDIVVAFTEQIEQIPGWDKYIIDTNYMQIFEEHKTSVPDIIELEKLYDSMIKDQFLQIYSPAESFTNEYLKIEDAPETTLDDALALLDDFPFYHRVDNSTAKEFWNVLIFLNRERESKRADFENLEENLDKTKKQLIAEFDNNNPKIIDRLSILWNTILSKAGLEFDIANIKNPVQNDDNLRAFIKLKNSGRTIKYNELSTGIRNFIFRIGHICSLYFNRTIKSGFLLVDEPENSLYPDFLLDLADIYSEAVIDSNNQNNTQIFMATHSPLVAGQFEPAEKFVLDWDEEGFITLRKGQSPAGDDPNDVLKQDFGLSEVLGKKGIEMWEKFVGLKQQLQENKANNEKQKIIKEIVKIQELYKF